MASGVVRTASRVSPPTTFWMVPSMPVRTPAASSTSRMRKALVVLPLVPVMPTIFRRAVGSPCRAAAAGAIAARTSGTSTCGTGGEPGSSATTWSTTSAAAPSRAASSAKSWPSRVKPVTQKKTVPSPTVRWSYARADTSVRGSSSSPAAPVSANTSRSSIGRSLVRGAATARPPQGAMRRAGRAKSAILPKAGAATSPP